MKSCEEIAHEALEKRDEYENQKRVRRENAVKRTVGAAMALALVFGVAAIVGGELKNSPLFISDAAIYAKMTVEEREASENSIYKTIMNGEKTDEENTVELLWNGTSDAATYEKFYEIFASDSIDVEIIFFELDIVGKNEDGSDAVWYGSVTPDGKQPLYTVDEFYDVLRDALVEQDSKEIENPHYVMTGVRFSAANRDIKSCVEQLYDAGEDNVTFHFADPDFRRAQLAD